MLQGSSDAMAHPLYAINWFNTRVAWVYHLYNLLAAGRLRRVGGRPFFKGTVSEMLAGNGAMARQHLLVVNYPSAERFLELAADRVFQLTSVLRLLTVKDFSFVFHQRRDDGQKQPVESLHWEKSHAFAVLHFSSPQPVEAVVTALQATCETNRIRILFAGHRAVTMNVRGGGANEEKLPFVTENTIILESNQSDALRQLFTEEHSQRWKTGLSDFYAALVDRTL